MLKLILKITYSTSFEFIYIKLQDIYDLEIINCKNHLLKAFYYYLIEKCIVYSIFIIVMAFTYRILLVPAFYQLKWQHWPAGNGSCPPYYKERGRERDLTSFVGSQ